MEDKENRYQEKKIINDLTEVHQSVQKDSQKAYNPDEVKPAIDSLAEQIKGSDADSDQGLEQKSNESEKLRESEGGDAERS